MNQTPSKVIYLVIIAIATLAFIGVGALCASLFLHVYAEPSILTALITTTASLTGSLVTLLANTRTQPQTGGGEAITQMSSTITTTTKPQETIPQPAGIQNTQPIPVTESQP